MWMSLVPSFYTSKERMLCVQNLVQGVASKMGMDVKTHPITIILDEDPFRAAPAARIFSGINELKIPAFLLLDPKEIPERFRFNGPEDLLLNDIKIIQEFVDWICEKFFLPKIEVDSKYKEFIRIYLQYIQKPEKQNKELYLY